MSSESSVSLSDWLLLDYEDKAGDFSEKNDSSSSDSISDKPDEDMAASMKELEDSALNGSSPSTQEEDVCNSGSENQVDESPQKHKLLEKFLMGDDKVMDHNEDNGLEPEGIELQVLHAAKHEESSSSSSDISIIEENVKPYGREDIRREERRPVYTCAMASQIRARGRPAIYASFRRKEPRRSESALLNPLADEKSLVQMHAPLICFVLVVGMLGIFLIRVFVPYNPYWDVGKIHMSLLLCLGKQNLEALEKGDTVLHLSAICSNQSEEWKDVHNLLEFEELLTSLSDVQKLLAENGSAEVSNRWDVKHINIRLIIQHLEHYEILPKLLSNESHYKEATYKLQSQEEDDLITQMQQAVKNLSILNEDLQDHVKLITSRNDSSLRADSRETAERNNTSLLTTLEEKVKVMVAQNEELKSEIYNLKKSPDNEDMLLNQKIAFKDAGSLKFDFGKMDAKETLDVAHLIRLLQNSFDEKFQAMEKFHEFLEELKSELKVLLPSLGKKPEKSEWSWDNLKADMEMFLQKKHDDLKETVNSYKNINVAETLNGYVQNSKKHAENTLRFVTQLVKVAREKTKEMFDEKIDVEKTAGGVWSMWGAIKNEWSDMKQRFDDLTGNVSPDLEAAKSSTENRKGPAESKSCSGKLSSGDILNGNNWFLKRAALRENQRSSKLPLNWYLRREMFRERARKWQQEKKYLRS